MRKIEDILGDIERQSNRCQFEWSELKKHIERLSNKIVGMVKDAHVGASVEIAQADTNSSSGMQVFLETQPFSIGGITGANMKIKYYQINPKTKFKQSWTADVIATTAPSVDKVKENIPRRDMIMVSKYMEPLLEELAMKIKKMADETEAARKKLETP